MKALFDSIRAGGSPALSEFINALGTRIDALSRLAETPQDPTWHAEGDVFTHTEMVLNEVYELLEGPASHLKGERRLALVLSAVFHDIAKPMTTRERELHGVMRTVAPRHEQRGRSYLAPLLAGQGLMYKTLETLLGLVGYHIEPKFLVVKARGAGAYRRLCRVADPELLYWLELADMRGRICSDQAEQVEHIEMFRLFAQEYDSWRRFGTFLPSWRSTLLNELNGFPPDTIDLVLANSLRDLENETIFTPEEAIAKSHGYRDSHPEVVVTVGLSGSGKSTWVAKHLKDHKLVSLDKIREEIGRNRSDQSQNAKVVEEGRQRLRQYLREKKRIVWDATSLRRDYRSGVANLAFDYGALVTLVVFHRSVEACMEQNGQRTDEVPGAVIAQQLKSTQWPELTEAHRVIVVGENDRVVACFGRVAKELPFATIATETVFRDSVS
jgi:predicted kinase